jgi:hypothetical protein
MIMRLLFRRKQIATQYTFTLASGLRRECYAKLSVVHLAKTLLLCSRRERLIRRAPFFYQPIRTPKRSEFDFHAQPFEIADGLEITCARYSKKKKRRWLPDWPRKQQPDLPGFCRRFLAVPRLA